jgi:capsular polysaccharide biosynthesis protein
MQNIQYSKILRKNWEIIASIVGLSVVLALIINLFLPFQYSATTKILIIQKQSSTLDAYTATKSAERIGQNLSSIINTSSFYNEVLAANSGLQYKFSQDSVKRMKTWERNVKVNVIPETGILEINAYDTDRDFASQLVRAIAYVLVNKGAEYHGGGNDVEIKIVDDVFVSKYPVRPNIILNMTLAGIIGIVLGCTFVILNESKKLKSKNELKNVSNDLVDDEIGFAPELASTAEPIQSRDVEIRTMYDHLQS